MADELRDRIAEALEAVTETDVVARGRFAAVPSPAAFAALVDAVWTVVAPEWDAAGKRLEYAQGRLRDADTVNRGLRTALETVEAERDALKATVERVRALLDDPARRYDLIEVHVLRAALDHPTDCERCYGSKVEPGTEEWNVLVHAYDPHTAQRCSACDGTGKGRS